MSSSLVNFDDMIAGHSFHPGCKAGVAQESNTGYILKVADGDERGRRELQFYERVWTDSHPHCVKLRQFIAKFHGHAELDGRTFIRLENVSAKHDCVMDIKIGSRTWDKLASDEKILIEKNKYPYGLEMGFRLLGFRTFEGTNCVNFTKNDAKAVSSHEIVDKMAIFLSPSGDGNLRKRRKDSFLIQLNNILSFMKEQNLYEFVSSSLLMTYKSESSDSLDDTKVTMIDFAHAHPLDNEKDDNYTSGLDNFINIFSTIQ